VRSNESPARSLGLQQMISVLGFIVVGVVAIIVVLPLLRPTTPAVEPEDGPDGDLFRRRDTLYREIADLDFDFGSGKVSESDYQTQREDYIDEAADVLRLLDENAVDDVSSNQWSESIEDELRQLRGRPVNPR